MQNIFIAPKIKVGFQKRSDTFTGQLAYIIYFDEKGKIRKEKSWTSWRDKKIEPQEFDNAPIDGFTLNKDVKRYSGEWFSSHRTMIRVHDPRGFEFEVTTENLIGILMHTDCLRRGLIGKFVYAWAGPELVLLPTNSEEYQKSAKYTIGLSKKVSAKDIVPGISYKTKREGDVIYMGRLNWYEYKGKRYYNASGLRKEEKSHVFTKDDGKNFFKKPSIEFLAEANNDQPVSNFAELMEEFNKRLYANKIARYEFRPTTFDESTKSSQYDLKLCRGTYFHETSPGVFSEAHASLDISRDYNNAKPEYKINGYTISLDDPYGRSKTAIKVETGELFQTDSTRTSNFYSYHRVNIRDLAFMKEQKLFDFYVVFENGKEKKIDNFYNLN